VESLKLKCSDGIREYLSQSSGAHVQKVATQTGKLVALGLSTAVFVSAIIFVCFGGMQIINPGDTSAISTPVVEQQGEVFKPNAEIVLESEPGNPGQVNPYSAKLIIEEGETSGWSIVDSAGDIILSGDGAEFNIAPGDLTQGSYSIEWLVKNKTGDSAKVVRSIEIE
jgi:hypothetical protein